MQQVSALQRDAQVMHILCSRQKYHARRKESNVTRDSNFPTISEAEQVTRNPEADAGADFANATTYISYSRRDG